LLTCTRNSDSTQPLADFRATSLSGAVRLFGNSTAPTPAASALRKTGTEIARVHHAVQREQQ
jgi:hypothetical protein